MSRLAISWRALFVAIAIASANPALAKTTGVVDDPALQQGPCYQTLVDRNVAQPTTAPNRELGAACAAENGDIEKAWARVIRLWGSDSTDIPDYGSYVPANAGSSSSLVWTGLALLGVLLALAVLGTPIRPAAKLLTGETRSRAAAAAAGLDIAARLAISLLLLAVVALPGGSLLAMILVIVFIARQASHGSSKQSDAALTDNDQGPAAIAAEVINDALGVGPALLALALFSLHDARVLIGSTILSIFVSIPMAILMRRQLSISRTAWLICAAALSALCAASALADPLLLGAIPSNSVAYLAASAFGAAIIVAASQMRVLSRAP
jgi:hypothetical protein